MFLAGVPEGAIVISLVVFAQLGEATGPCAAPLGEVERMGEVERVGVPVPEDVVELKEDDWNGPGVCFGGDGGACLD